MRNNISECSKWKEGKTVVKKRDQNIGECQKETGVKNLEELKGIKGIRMSGIGGTSGVTGVRIVGRCGWMSDEAGMSESNRTMECSRIE